MLIKSLALVGLTLSINTHAALIDDGSYVSDNETWIDYLKLSETSGLSWDEVVNDDVTGYIAAGWEVASRLGLMALDEADRTAFELLTVGNLIIVITNNDGRGEQTEIPVGILPDQWVGPGAYDTGALSVPTHWHASSFAVALSRPSEVPLPAAAWLFISAIGGLVAQKRLSRRSAG